METTNDEQQSNQTDLDLESVDGVIHRSDTEYVQFQKRIFRSAFLLTIFSVGICAYFFSYQTSISFLIGAFSGIFYLRILARSIGNLGKSSNSVGKIQLIVPVLLVLVVSKLPSLNLLPALLGFLLFKPSLIIQVWLESRTQASS